MADDEGWTVGRTGRVVAAIVGMLILAVGALTVVGPLTPASASTRYPWSQVASPNVGAGDNTLSDVSCVPGGFCMAVGASTSGGIDQTLSEVAGWIWTVVPSPNASVGANDLYGVSCTSNVFCVAVGRAVVHGAQQTLTLAWDGIGWRLVPSPDVSATEPQSLFGVSCLSPTDCTAVGSDLTVGGSTATLVERWNGVSWTIVPSPNAPGGYSSLNGVSCLSATLCTAVGQAFNGVVDQALVEQWNGVAWSISPAPSGSTTVAAALTSVSCLSPVACTAVGYTSPDSSFQTLILQWNGVQWAIVASPDTAPTDADLLQSVSCGSPTSCTAAGSASPDDTSSTTLVEQWDGGAWSIVPTAVDPADPDAELLGVSCTNAWTCTAVGDTPDDAPIQTRVLTVEPGYWEVARDGGIFSFGSSGFFGSMGGKPLAAPIVGITATADRQGYWEVASDGGLFDFGDAGFFGSMGGKSLNSPIVGIAATADGQGYWMVASDGGLFSFGDAGYFGSMGGKPLNSPIVGIAATPDGQGYWEVASDGGLFSFGDAGYFGSMGGLALNEPVVGIDTTADGQGYWMVASDGGIFSFGDAGFLGSMGGTPLNEPIVQLG